LGLPPRLGCAIKTVLQEALYQFQIKDETKLIWNWPHTLIESKELPLVMLTGKQKRHLRALGHKLKALIQIGKKEIEEALITETNAALDHHELIKVKLLESCMLDKHEASEMLAGACGAEVAQILGKTFLLYRPATPPVIVLPTADKAARNIPA